MSWPNPPIAGPPMAEVGVREAETAAGKPPNAEAVSGPSNPEAGAGEPPNAGLAAIDECPKAGSAGAPKAKAARAADDDDCPNKLMK